MLECDELTVGVGAATAAVTVSSAGRTTEIGVALLEGAEALLTAVGSRGRLGRAAVQGVRNPVDVGDPDEFRSAFNTT